MFNSKFYLVITSLIVFLLTVSSVTNFAQAQNSDWYGAITAGQGEASADDFDTSSSTSIYLGNRYDKKSAYEFGYIDLGEFDLEGFNDTYVEITGFEISGLGIARIGESSEFFGKFGIFLWESDGEALGNSVDGDDDISLLLGLGANIPFSQSVGLRLELVDYLNVDDEDIINLSIGLFVKF